MNKLVVAILWAAAMLAAFWALTLTSPDASATPADPACDVYNRTCWPQYCYGTGGWTSPYSGYCPDILGPPYGRGNTR
jgi:hypothetical protein